jgi:hypothetical protein
MTSPASRTIRNTTGLTGATLDDAIVHQSQRTDYLSNFLINLNTGNVADASGLTASDLTAALRYLDARITAGGGGGGLTTEQVQDIVAAMLVAGSNITLTYNDADNTLTVASTAGGGSVTWGGITGTLANQTDLNTVLNGKEPTIAAGSAGQFWGGTKAWSDFATSVRASVLTGFSTASAALVTASDTVLSALGKLQAQVATKADSLAGLLTRPTINSYKEAVTAANSGTAYTFDISSSANFLITLTGNCTYTFPTAEVGRTFVVKFVQDATGGRTITLPTVKWPGGTAPTWTATANKGDRVAFTCFDGTNWEGLVAGQNI